MASSKALRAKLIPGSTTTSSRVFYNTAIQFVGRAILLVAGFISITVLTRYLGVGNYGRLSIVTVYVSFVITLSDWGISTIVTRELSKQPEKENGLITTAILGRLIISIPLVLVSIVAARFFYPADETVQLGVAILSLSVFANVLISTLSSVFQVRLRNDIPVAAEILGRVFYVVMILAAVRMGRGVQYILLASLLGIVIQACLLAAFAYYYKLRIAKADFRIFWTLFIASLPLGLAFVLNSIYFKVDTIILSFLRTPYEVGIYAAAYRILEMVLIFPSIFATTIFPLLAKYHNQTDRLKGILQRSMRFMFLMGAPMMVGGVLLAQEIVLLVGGQSFSASSRPFQVLMVSAFVSFFNIVYGLAIIAINKQKNVLWINIFGLVLNITLNYIFIPHFGYMAAAYNTLLSEVFVLLSNAFMLKRYTGIQPITNPAKILGATAVMAAFIFAAVQFHVPILFTIMLSALTYGLACLALRATSITEIKELVGAA